MASPRPSLASFLAESKRLLREAKQAQSKISIVAGNESADLDSMISATIFAYLRSQAPPLHAFAQQYIPLINVPAEDLRLRPEFDVAFQGGNIDPSTISTLDDLDLRQKDSPRPKPSQTSWILVDHNKLEGELGVLYGARVNGVVDHHVEENAVPFSTKPEPRVVEICGSCTSLVIRELLLKSKDDGDASNSNGTGRPSLDAAAARFALASILIDTKNLQDASKTTPTDEQAVACLEDIVQAADPSWNRNSYFEQLSKAKKAIEHLPLQGILRKDYKQWTENGLKLGMSTVVKSLDFLVHKTETEAAPGGTNTGGNAWDEQVLKFMRDRGLQLWAIGTTFNTKRHGKKQHTRQICLQYREGHAEEAAVTQFESLATASLGLEQIAVAGIASIQSSGIRQRIWNQQDVAKSRKQVAPLLRQAMREIKR